MTPALAKQIVTRGARGWITRKTYEVMTQVQFGKQRQAPNPFTGELYTQSISPEVEAIAEKIRALGLHQDEQFMEVFESFVDDVGSHSVHALLSSIDTGNWGRVELDVELRVRDGCVIPSTLSDDFFPLHREEDQPD